MRSVVLSLLFAFWNLGIAAQAYEIDRVQEGVVYFKNQKPLKTGLVEVKPLGILRPQDSSTLPFLLLAGRTCINCDQDSALFLFRVDGKSSTHFVYPGKVVDPKMGQLVYESKAYFGKCLRGKGDVYVVFQKERVDRRGHMKQSAFIMEPASPYLKETLLERGLPSQSSVQQMVKRKECTEIAGRSRTALKKPLDLKPRNTEEEEDDDEDEEIQNGEKVNPTLPTTSPTPAASDSPKK